MSEEMQQETTQETTLETTEETTQETTQETIEETTPETIQETTPEVIQETCEETTATENVPETIPVDVPEDVPKDVTGDVPQTECVEAEVEYCCPPEFDEKEELCKMFVGGLGKDTTDEEFKTMFDKFGAIKDSVIIRKGETRGDRLFGFITFAKCDNLDDCLLQRPHKYQEKELDVKRAVPKGQSDGTGHYQVKKLHLGNVPTSFDTNTLLKYLKSRHPKIYGEVNEIELLKVKDDSGNPTEKNRGFGFISVSSEDFADRISIAESKFVLDGNTLRISKAKPKPGEGGAPRGGRGKGRGVQQRGGRQGGGWDNWGYGGGYGGGYDYGYGGNGYGYGGAYDYYSYAPGYRGYSGSPAARGRGIVRGKRHTPY